MKTILKLTALFFAASVPAALAAASYDVPLPAGFDAVTALAGFAASLIALVALTDYSRVTLPDYASRRVVAATTAPIASAVESKAAHALAA